MARQPFVWEVHVRREMVEDELVRLRELPYGREAIGAPRTKAVTGRDSREYTMTISADWVRRGSEDIRVTVTLAPARRRRTLREQSFVITPTTASSDGWFRLST